MHQAAKEAAVSDDPKTKAQLIEELQAAKEEIARLKETDNDLASMVRPPQLLDAIPHNALIVAPDHTILHANKAAQDVSGLSLEELKGRKCHQVFHLESGPAKGCPLQKAVASKKPQAETMIMQGMHGTYHVACTPIFDDAGNLQSIVHIATDISELARAERERNEAEDTYRLIFHNSPDEILYIDRWGKVVDVNDRVRDIFGLEPEEVLGKRVTYFAKYARVSVARIMELFKRVLSQDDPLHQVEMECRHKDGHTIYVEFHAALIRKKGRVEGIQVNVRDITDRKRAEAELYSQSELTRNITDTSPIGITVVDPDGRLSYANPAAEALFGLQKDKLLKRTYNDPHWKICDIDGGPFPDDQLAFNRVMQSGHAVFDVQHGVETPDGRRILLSVNAAPMRNSSGNITGMVAIMTDITERKQSEDEIRKNRLLLDKLFTSIPDMLSVHDRDMNIVYSNWNGFGAVEQEKRVLGSKCYTTYRGFDDLCPDCEAKRVLENGETVLVRKKVVEGIWAEIRAFPIHNEHGDAEYLVEWVRDITDVKQSESDLHASEERFRSMTEQSTDFISLTDTEGIITYASPAASSVFGLAAEDMLGRHFMDFLDESSIPKAMQGFQESVNEGGKSRNLELLMKRRDGSRFVGELNGALFESGDRQGTLVVIRDISERKHAEEELRHSEEKYRLIAENSSDVVWRMELDGRFSYVSPSVMRMTGFTQEEVMQMTVADYVTEESAEAIMNLMAEQLALPKEERLPSIVQEFQQHTKAGSILDIEASATWVYDKEGAPTAVQGITRDISERKQAEAELRASEEKHRLFIENFNGIAYQASHLTFKPYYFHGMVKEISGYDGQDFLSGRTVWSDLILQEDLPRVRKLGERLMNDPSFVADSEYRIQRKDGGLRWVRDVARCIPDASGNPVNIQGAIYDVTKANQDAEEKEKLQQQLNQAQKMESVGRLAGGVAHDFNNLLTGITGNVSLAMMDLTPGDPLLDALSEINQAADSAANLTRQLLAFSRKQIIKPKVLDLNELIDNMHKMLVRLIGEDVDLQTIPTRGLGHVKADVGQVEQILVNLAVNARDAMPDGGKLTVETADVKLDEAYCRAHPHVEPGDYVMLAVSDNGEGMDEETRKKVFDPFFTTKKEGEGTGLGLATVYGIVKQHGGHIEVYSERGEGTTFKVYFPTVVERAEAFIRKTEMDDLPKGTETVLVVEDESMVRKIAIRILKRQGYTVHHADSGGDALAKVEDENLHIDLLLTDIVMPNMNGRQLVEKLQERFGNMKVLYTSGYTENVIAHHGVLDEGVDFIGKPYTPQALAKKVRAVLDG